MATYKRNFSSSSEVLNVTLSGTTESLSSNIDLETNGYEGTHITVDVNFDTTPTDDVDVNIYGSLDGSNYDDTPVFTQRIDNGTDPNQISIIIKDLLHLKVGCVQTGSTDSHDVVVTYQAWNYTDA